MHSEIFNLREVIVFLIAAGVVVPLIHRFRISPVLGFLVVGLLIGPYGLARFIDMAPWLAYVVIADPDGVRALGELGVVFLLFMIGLELSVERLWAMRRLVFGLGGAQIMLTGALIAGVALMFDNSLPAAAVLGAGFALSSTAIVMQLLSDNRRLGTETGRTGFAILLAQDLAVLPILFLVATFGAQSDGSALTAFATAIGKALLAVTIIFVAGRTVIRPLFSFIGNDANREMFLALVLLVIIGAAYAAGKFGLSMALGAFMAGLLLAESEYRHEIEVDIEPFKGLLLGLFFLSVGMSIDIAHIAADPLWIIASVVGLFLIKSPIIYGLSRMFGQPRSVSLEVALLLGQGGEFAFMVVGMAAMLGLLPADTTQFMLIVTGLTMMITPLVSHFARQIARAVEAREAQSGQPDADLPGNQSGHVIIAGYGRVGQMLGSVLDAQGWPHLGLDIDAGVVARFRSDGGSVFYGDASRPDMLNKFGIEQAAALVVTMDSAVAAEAVVAAARRRWPNLPIYARARDVEHATRLIERGASHVVPEATEASLQLGEIVLTGLGVPDQAARRMIEGRRQIEQAAVDAGYN